ncbi:MAG: hypothetical protein LBG19_11275 [Prevotellaceae bacterium]|nr:hypothetical protein [Prevotellaceae bacterium]
MVVPVALKGDKELIEEIFTDGTDGVNDKLLRRYAGGYEKAVNNVFGSGKQLPELERRLQLNAGRFGTYKAYDLGKRLDALRSLPREEYQEKAKALLATYNGYQKTEYDTLTSRCRTAKQWERFKEEADLYPNIEWIRTRSATPREVHLAYVGIILPRNDPFWSENQPGNEWGCKCDWKTTDAPATASPAVSIKPAPGLEGNPGETGELVTERHPYYRRNTDAPKWVEDKAVLRCPDRVVYSERATTAGNAYKEHLLVVGTREVARNRLIAALLADNGYRDIALLPRINEVEKAQRIRYFGAKYTTKHPTANPDAVIDGINVEFKVTNFRNMSRQIKRAATQADIAVLKVEQSLTDNYIQRFVKGQWAHADRQNLSEIIIINNGRLHRFKRP